MITFTDSAIKHLSGAIDSDDMIRIGIIGGGCSGFTYDMEVVSEPSKDDIILEFDNLKICMNPQSSFMLSETTVDYETSLTQSGFKFINNQATKSCGCGKSFSCE